MNSRSLLLMVLVAVLACVSLQHTEAQCARVRKNWNALTAQEKATYIGAVQSAMDSGAYTRFIEMHTEMMSEMEAHQQCMFIYWHRMFLLVFENMLRGQGAQYACVTVPYWDWITDQSRYLAGQCRSMGGCSSALTELGGVPAGMRQSTVNIYGYGVSGFCVNTSPLDHFCESASRCTRCVPRGNWNAAVPPGASSYASVMSQIFGATSIGQMSPRLEQGAHNNIHSSLDGIMATLLSPADPVFYVHHSMVDLLHVIFHKCRVGTAQLTFEQKASHPVAWASCGRRNGGAFNPTDVITMRTGGGSTGRAVISGSQDPLLARFFQGVPNRFADLMDARDLGYTYELSGLTATMYDQCDGTTVTPRPAPVPAPQPVPVPAVVRPTVVQPTTIVRPSTQRWTFRWPFGLGRSLRATEDIATQAPVSAKVRAADSEGASFVVSNPAKQVAMTAPTTAPIEPATNAVVLKDSSVDPAVQKVQDWYDAMVTAVGGPSQKALDEVERMACMYQDECLGGVQDFSPEFKKTWGAGTARCKAIVDDLKAGTTSICVTDWKQQMIDRFGCPVPKSSGGSSNSPVQKAV